MNEEKTEQIIREYIPQVIHLSLATAKDNKPWVCEVHFAYDNDLNLYFISSDTTRHAQEIAANSYVAGNIVAQHQKDEKPRGVYFEGKANTLSGAEAEKARGIYAARFGEERINEFVANDPSIQFFQITVGTFYLFDTRGEHRGKYTLPWGHKNLGVEV